MGRRTALILGAVMLATAPAVARAQASDSASQVGVPPPDMPAADGARMAALEIEATAAIEAGDWSRVEQLIREGLSLEQRHYAPTDARIGHSWGWLARAAIEQGRAPTEVLPLAQQRLEIAEHHPEDGDTLSQARYMMAMQLMAADRPADALPLLRQIETWLEGQGPTGASDLLAIRAAIGMALIAGGERDAGVASLTDVMQALMADPSSDLDLRARYAWELGVALHDQQRYAEVEPWFRLAMDRYAATGARAEETRAAYWLADTLGRLDRRADADALLARAVALDSAVPIEQRAVTTEQLRTDISAYGDRMRTAREWTRAEAAYRLLVEANRTRADEPRYLAASLGRLGLALAGAERWAEAEAAQSETVELWRRVHDGPHRDIALSLEQLGQTRLGAEKHRDAHTALDSALKMLGELNEEPSLRLLSDAAEAAEKIGLLVAAGGLRRRQVDRLMAEEPRRPDVLAAALGDTGHVMYLADRSAEAENLYRRALEMAVDERVIETLKTGLAFALADQGRGEEGEPLQRDVLAAIAARDGPESLKAALAMGDLANLLAKRGDYARAEPLLRDALALFQASEERHPQWIATLKFNLASALNGQGRTREALVLGGEAFRERRELFGGGHPSTILVVGFIARLYIELGAYEAAEPLMAQMVQVREAQMGSEHPHFAQALQMHAYVLQHMGRSVEAEALMRRAVSIFDQASQDPQEKIRARANWGVTLLTSDRPAEALGVFRGAQSDLSGRRRLVSDPNWSRNEGDSFRFLFRFSVQAAWKAAAASTP